MLVPPNWDSWGKIRVLREGFDVEAVNQGWSLDLQAESEDAEQGKAAPGGALVMYEETIVDPVNDATSSAIEAAGSQKDLDVKSIDTQIFLTSQLEILESLRQGSEHKGLIKKDGVYRTTSAASEMGSTGTRTPMEGKNNDHIGSVQFNMGGVQVDAEDMLQRLKVRVPAF